MVTVFSTINLNLLSPEENSFLGLFSVLLLTSLFFNLGCYTTEKQKQFIEVSKKAILKILNQKLLRAFLQVLLIFIVNLLYAKGSSIILILRLVYKKIVYSLKQNNVKIPLCIFESLVWISLVKYVLKALKKSLRFLKLKSFELLKTILSSYNLTQSIANLSIDFSNENVEKFDLSSTNLSRFSLISQLKAHLGSCLQFVLVFGILWVYSSFNFMKLFKEDLLGSLENHVSKMDIQVHPSKEEVTGKIIQRLKDLEDCVYDSKKCNRDLKEPPLSFKVYSNVDLLYQDLQIFKEIYETHYWIALNKVAQDMVLKGVVSNNLQVFYETEEVKMETYRAISVAKAARLAVETFEEAEDPSNYRVQIVLDLPSTLEAYLRRFGAEILDNKKIVSEKLLSHIVDFSLKRIPNSLDASLSEPLKVENETIFTEFVRYSFYKSAFSIGLLENHVYGLDYFPNASLQQKTLKGRAYDSIIGPLNSSKNFVEKDGVPKPLKHMSHKYSLCLSELGSIKVVDQGAQILLKIAHNPINCLDEDAFISKVNAYSQYYLNHSKVENLDIKKRLKKETELIRFHILDHVLNINEFCHYVFHSLECWSNTIKIDRTQPALVQKLDSFSVFLQSALIKAGPIDSRFWYRVRTLIQLAVDTDKVYSKHLKTFLKDNDVSENISIYCNIETAIKANGLTKKEDLYEFKKERIGYIENLLRAKNTIGKQVKNVLNLIEHYSSKLKHIDPILILKKLTQISLMIKNNYYKVQRIFYRFGAPLFVDHMNILQQHQIKKETKNSSSRSNGSVIDDECSQWSYLGDLIKCKTNIDFKDLNRTDFELRDYMHSLSKVRSCSNDFRNCFLK